MNTKDLIKTIDTKAIKDKADCFKRGDDWYEVEPKWDRVEYDGYDLLSYKYVNQPITLSDCMYPCKYYKEFEVTEDGEPIGYMNREEHAKSIAEHQKDVRPQTNFEVYEDDFSVLKLLIIVLVGGAVVWFISYTLTGALLSLI